MFPNAKAFVAVASCALLAAAQVTTSSSAAASQTSSATAGLDSCILTCYSQAGQLAGSCSDYNDVSCVCTNGVFQLNVTNCLTQYCTPADILTAQQLQQKECGGTVITSSSANAAAPSTVVAPSSSTPTTASSSSASASASSSAAKGLTVPFSAGMLVGMLVASAGAMVGAAFVL